MSYTRSTNFAAGKLARASLLDAEFESIETNGFDALNIDRSASAGEAIDAMTETSSERASKWAAFDSNGKPTVSTTATVGDLPTGGVVGDELVYHDSPAWGGAQVDVAASKTLALTDVATRQVVAGAGSDITFTVPLNSAVALPAGFRCSIIFASATGSEKCLIDFSAGVTIASLGNFTTNTSQAEHSVPIYSMIELIKVDTDSWMVAKAGDLPTRYNVAWPALSSAFTSGGGTARLVTTYAATNPTGSTSADAYISFFATRYPVLVSGMSILNNSPNVGTALIGVYALDGADNVPSTRIATTGNIDTSLSARANYAFNEGSVWLPSGNYCIWVDARPSGGSSGRIQANLTEAHIVRAELNEWHVVDGTSPTYGASSRNGLPSPWTASPNDIPDSLDWTAVNAQLVVPPDRFLLKNTTEQPPYDGIYFYG